MADKEPKSVASSLSFADLIQSARSRPRTSPWWAALTADEKARLIELSTGLFKMPEESARG